MVGIFSDWNSIRDFEMTSLSSEVGIARHRLLFEHHFGHLGELFLIFGLCPLLIP